MTLTLDQLIKFTIKLDNLLRTRRTCYQATAIATPNHSSPPGFCGSDHVPMQLGSVQLTPGEKVRRFQENLCLYYSQPGHIQNTCSNCPPRRSGQSMSDLKLTFILPVTVRFDSYIVETKAMGFMGFNICLGWRCMTPPSSGQNVHREWVGCCVAAAALDGALHRCVAEVLLGYAAIHREGIPNY